MAVTHHNCIHCVNIKPHLDRLYRNVKNSSENINFLNVHGDTFQAVKSKLPSDYQKVQGYPTLLTNSEGKLEEYEGPREYESILEHCINKLNITDPEIINIIKSGGKKKSKKRKSKKRKSKKHKSKKRKSKKHKSKKN